MQQFSKAPAAQSSSRPPTHNQAPPTIARGSSTSSRRGFLTGLLLAQVVTPQPASQLVASAAEPEPACASCVGYVDGTLGSCSAVEGPCTSSYDDRPPYFVAPWEYDGNTQAAMRKLVSTLESVGARVDQQTADYVYAVLDQGGSSALDLEFVFATNDNTVALRAAQHTPAAAAPAAASSSSSSRGSGDPAEAAIAVPVNAVSSLLSQIGFMSRPEPSTVLEELRMQLGWEVVPILRNRQRFLLFGESPFDSFGPVPPPTPDYSKDLLTDY